MKKMMVLLLIVVCFCFMGCSKNEDMSSLSEYEMVKEEKIKGIAVEMTIPV